MAAPALYVPVLVGKVGEFEALRALPTATLGGLRPIFDLAPIAAGKDVAAVIEDLVTRVGRALANDGAAAVDLMALEGASANDAHPVDYLLTRAEWCGGAVQVAVRTDAPQAYVDAVATHHRRSRGVCIRARVREDGNPAVVAARVGELLDTLGLRPDEVHLCLDCGHIGGWAAFPDRIMAAHLLAYPDLRTYRLVSVAATNVPANEDISRRERPKRVQRREWTAWKRLTEAGFDVVFGDYGITGPRPLTPPNGRPAPHLRYTTSSALEIWRGQRADLITEEDEELPTSFRDLCRELMDDKEFNEELSDGDRAFAAIAAGKQKTKAGQPSEGNSSQWVQWATNHHLAHVVHELSV